MVSSPGLAKSWLSLLADWVFMAVIFRHSCSSLLLFYSHYFFVSRAAHIGAMFTAFLSIASALGTPSYPGAIVLSFLSNLMGGITHYGIGPAPVFYSAGYLPLAKCWGYGFLISVVNLIIWLEVGGAWWKFISLW
ncbi:dicarboxylate transporter 1, chloroplastic-like [Olea europaea subsp. europaea]|uniref:Dicarboxylate transporter 1, chloroplastic-like n=1 Tax=Olea europaea subsp. europaea TaxID=158383 RepID=A0A8S0RI08_OLEEU|nr:dicarboxylate transporter 1, chloroplastic-like [Olea europaea subsp. europaea]